MNAMMMIERWPDHGAEIRVYTLTPEEIASNAAAAPDYRRESQLYKAGEL